ncbi:uncharacterized protein TM35_000084660 [Trypanosoma theileri]|uniref:Uncharacterized protein n=1 Tax=Trypanosoma theileri TaxID=67003 RepID=A0A1X0P1F0_9TRYP|nr:uncharacterized protein TM35_000084660 [Trypanosoma theileri]ORC90668.1 hypothetical protein TM35_000084660 [Trypanosoma theileri]
MATINIFKLKNHCPKLCGGVAGRYAVQHINFESTTGNSAPLSEENFFFPEDLWAFNGKEAWGSTILLERTPVLRRKAGSRVGGFFFACSCGFSFCGFAERPLFFIGISQVNALHHSATRLHPTLREASRHR